MRWDSGGGVFLGSHRGCFPMRGGGQSLSLSSPSSLFAYLGFLPLPLCTFSSPSPSPFPPFFPFSPFCNSPSSSLSTLVFGFFAFAAPASTDEVARLRAIGDDRFRPLRVVVVADRVWCMVDAGVVVGCGCGGWMWVWWLDVSVDAVR